MSKLIELHDIGLTDEQKKQLSDWLEILMGHNHPKRKDQYFDGVLDGLYYAHKIVNNIDDDAFKNE